MKKKETNEEFVNPIDPDKVAQNPHLLPYAHTVSGAVIKPVDRGRIKGQAVEAMYEQTDMQLGQIRKQIELLAEQAQAIQDRVSISEKIYQAELSIRPLIGHTYHLYGKTDDSWVLSMIGPEEWGSQCPYDFEATVRLLADHTWEIIRR